MRRRDHDGVGGMGRDAAGDLAIGVEGVLDGALLAASDGGHGERRMRTT